MERKNILKDLKKDEKKRESVLFRFSDNVEIVKYR